MKNNLVSAIITTHNRAPGMVLRAVNSALNQTYTNMELIIVDDSDNDFPERDEVERVVREASDRIRYIRHEESRGGCAARNTGLAQAKGYYVAFLDDDDEWLPRKTEEQMKGFTDQSIAIVYCGCRIINQATGEKYIRKNQFRRGKVYDELLITNFIGGTSNPLIKKECIEEVGGFDELMESAQDYDLWLRLSQRYSVNYIETPLINYYIHTGKRISTDTDRKIAGYERIIHKYHDDLIKNNMAWYSAHRQLLYFHIRKYGRRRSISLWLQCIKMMPGQITRHIKDFLLIILGPDCYLLFFKRVHALVGKHQSI